MTFTVKQWKYVDLQVFQRGLQDLFTPAGADPWSFKEKITAVIGSSWSRMRKTRYMRFDLESKMVLDLIAGGYNGYLLLGGAGYFGLGYGYNVELYYKCKDECISLLTISKHSPTLHDVDGRDLLTRIANYPRHPRYKCWVYHPVEKASPKKKSLWRCYSSQIMC